HPSGSWPASTTASRSPTAPPPRSSPMPSCSAAAWTSRGRSTPTSWWQDSAASLSPSSTPSPISSRHCPTRIPLASAACATGVASAPWCTGWSPQRCVSSHRGLCLPLHRRGGGGTEGLVHAARAEALQVEGDVQEAERLQLRRDLTVEVRLEQTRHLAGGQLDAGELLMVANAHVAEAEAAQVLFCLVDPGELLHGNNLPIGDAGREAGERRLVPGRDAQH